MAKKLGKFKNSDQINASRRDSKKSERYRGGAKNETYSYMNHLDEESDYDFSDIDQNS